MTWDSKRQKPQTHAKSTQIDPDRASTITNLVEQLPTTDFTVPSKRSWKEGSLSHAPPQCDRSNIEKGKVQKFGRQHNPKDPPISTQDGAIPVGGTHNLVKQMPIKCALGQCARSTQSGPDLTSVVPNLVEQMPTKCELGQRARQERKKNDQPPDIPNPSKNITFGDTDTNIVGSNAHSIQEDCVSTFNTTVCPTEQFSFTREYGESSKNHSLNQTFEIGESSKGSHNNSGTDRRRYNLPSIDEIAVILPGDGHESCSMKDIVVYLKEDRELMRINEVTQLISHYIMCCCSLAGN
ncbi:hypothetical protein GIB67_029417 [Kingdonia uniflora]|uniref:Uncharacterized protein n=1 Tax=Kingdonia uniflora TaxID=39325 RepID=A0A7J7NXV0_9MAGN|nr:hypothetical protein GIB67_029417 [Kingdonia uniflora]